MPRRLNAALLPPEVLCQLKDRLIASKFSNFQSHSDWLKSIGYDISKSALQRYSVKGLISFANRPASESEISSNDSSTEFISLHLQALCAVSGFSFIKNMPDAISAAEECLNWACKASR
jgi:hypothetical protein